MSALRRIAQLAAASTLLLMQTGCANTIESCAYIQKTVAAASAIYINAAGAGAISNEYRWAFEAALAVEKILCPPALPLQEPEPQQ